MTDLYHDDAAVLALKWLMFTVLIVVVSAWIGYFATRKPRNRRINKRVGK